MDLHLKSLFGRIHEQFGSGPGLGAGSGTCLMKVDGISPNFVKSIYRASAALYRSDPWRRLRPGHLFGVRVGKDSDWTAKKQPFPCVQFIGGDGGDIAIHMFRSHNDAKRMTGARETVRVCNVELLRVTYEKESLMFPSNVKMVKSLALEASGADRFPVVDVAQCTSSPNLRFRNPTLEELKFVYAVMKAISMVHPLLQVAKEGVPKRPGLVPLEPFIETVDAQWPVEMAKGGYDFFAITISHPPGQTYQEMESCPPSPTPKNYAESPREENFYGVEDHTNSGLRQCVTCEKQVSGDHTHLSETAMKGNT